MGAAVAVRVGDGVSVGVEVETCVEVGTGEGTEVAVGLGTGVEVEGVVGIEIGETVATDGCVATRRAVCVAAGLVGDGTSNDSSPPQAVIASSPISRAAVQMAGAATGPFSGTRV